MLKRTPLYSQCIKANGRMIPFGGWEMPVQFSGLIQEHHAVREKVGIFDISHMGILLLEGKNLKESLQELIPSDIFRISKGEAFYTVLLNENGGIIDDLIIYDLGDKLLLVINANCFENDSNWLHQKLVNKGISISDAKKNQIFIALQGPEAPALMEKISKDSIKNLPRFGHKEIQLCQLDLQGINSCLIARTGYTGEEGFELLMPEVVGKRLWSKLLQEGITPCGLGARDTLRLEAGMHLYGKDINNQTTPFEAGLGWLVHLEMPREFIGRKVLEKQAEKGIKRKLIALELENRAIPRTNYPVFHQKTNIGKITSGSWSPTLNKGIAFAYVPYEVSKIGTGLQVEIRGQLHEAKIVKKPFYRKSC